MAEPETDATDISVRAAEVATDISETDQAAERRRLVSTFTRAVVSGARAAGRGTRAVQRRAGDGTDWLADHVVAMAPRLRVRDAAALRTQFPGKSADEIADGAHRGRGPRRGGGGRRDGHGRRAAGAARLPGRDRGRDAGPGRDRAQARRRTARSVRKPGPGEVPRADERLRRVVGPSPRGVHDRGRADLRGRLPAGPAAAPPARLPGRPQRVLPRPDAHRRRRGRVVQPQGDQEARPGNPA